MNNKNRELDILDFIRQNSGKKADYSVFFNDPNAMILYMRELQTRNLVIKFSSVDVYDPSTYTTTIKKDSKPVKKSLTMTVNISKDGINYLENEKKTTAHKIIEEVRKETPKTVATIISKIVVALATGLVGANWLKKIIEVFCKKQ